MNIWEMLEEVAPSGCEGVQDLYSWNLNYDPGTGPFSLFLDLVGWSDENLGEDIYDYSKRNLGYVELSKLSTALEEYSKAPRDVTAYVDRLMEAEREE